MKYFGVPRPFNASDYPCGTVVYYCYWGRENERCTVCKSPPKVIQGQWWMRLKLDRLKNPLWVPVTSKLGCHLGLKPFENNDYQVLSHMDIDWEETYRKMLEEFRAMGIDVSRLERKEDVEVVGFIQ